MEEKQKTNIVKLIPVLELEPSNYQTKERSMPEAGNKIAWTKYWKACLLDSKLNLNPVIEGSWFVALSDLSDENLRIILEKELVDNYEPDQDISAMMGGLFLQVEKDNIIIEPSCCGDLSNIFDWVEASKYVGEEQKMLWIGHPWLMVSGDDNYINITPTVEQVHLPNPDTLSLNRSKIRKHLETSMKELMAFKARIFPYVKVVVGDKNAEKVSNMLVFGAHQTQNSDCNPV